MSGSGRGGGLETAQHRQAPHRHAAPRRRSPRPSVLALAVGGLAVLLVLLVVVVPRVGGAPEGEQAATPSSQEASPTPENTADLSDPGKRDVAMQLISS